jgi:hypothetical protein
MNFTRTEAGKQAEAAALVNAHESESCKTSLEVVGLLMAFRTRYLGPAQEQLRKPGGGTLLPQSARVAGSFPIRVNPCPSEAKNNQPRIYG